MRGQSFNMALHTTPTPTASIPRYIQDLCQIPRPQLTSPKYPRLEAKSTILNNITIHRPPARCQKLRTTVPDPLLVAVTELQTAAQHLLNAQSALLRADPPRLNERPPASQK